MKTIGQLLRLKRLEKGYTLDIASSLIGVSINYIAEIEKGNKANPSDHIIEKIAEVYGMDQDDLFLSFNKVPLTAKLEIEEHPTLARAISQIRNDKEMTPDKKEALYNKMVYWYKTLLEEEN
jgi:transcriptional regulator with XRE-family HTH domain